jgi:3-oxoacyl-[acyl-carrier-protein] synthase-1
MAPVARRGQNIRKPSSVPATLLLEVGPPTPDPALANIAVSDRQPGFPLTPLWISHFTATSGIGRGLPQTLAALRERRGGLVPCAFDTVDIPTFIGEVPGVDAVQLPAHLAAFDCRNNRLALLGLMQDGFADAVAAAVRKHGARRIGLFLGTSTSGILQTELAYRRRDPAHGALPADFVYATTHNTFSVADFARHYLGLAGPAVVVSSACSSSAKVFASAGRMMAAGLIDAAVVGGVDSLCLTTLYGFNSLGLISSRACRPFDVARDGISIGEAAAFALMERAPERLDPNAVLLLGVGESSDAYHMSSPHPDGLGARIAMQDALQSAGLDAANIDYINLHGTATPSNDAAETQAVTAVFGEGTPCSSTKGATGHTLGAAGSLEAVICALALQNELLPGGLNTQQLDPLLPLDYLLENRDQPVRRVLSNSFGFGAPVDRQPMTQPLVPGPTFLAVFVEGIGLIGPGLSNWAQGRQCLDGSLHYEAARCVLPLPMALPPAERRRAGAVVKVSLAVAQEAIVASGLSAKTLPSVFASSSGDAVNCHEICSALASDDRLISPTRFHNSVHNASSGYWSIASGAMTSSSVLCARDAGFAAGLLEAMTQCVVDDSAVLLVAYDTEYPEPLFSKRQVPDTMGVAMVLAPRPSERSMARIGLDGSDFLTGAAADTMNDAALERLRQSIPAARALPLLQCIAASETRSIALDYLDPMQLAVEVAPC